MSKQVWLLMINSGSYESEYEHPVRAYTDENKAIQAKDERNELLKKLGVHSSQEPVDSQDADDAAKKLGVEYIAREGAEFRIWGPIELKE